MMTSSNPDFFIYEDVLYDNFLFPFPGGSSRYKGRDLTLAFLDTKSKKRIWEGVAKIKIDIPNTPEEKEKLINSVVLEILKNFPPKPKEKFVKN